MADRGRTKRAQRKTRTLPAAPGRRSPSAARRKKVDSVDIARLVGVARSTVSKALNGYPYIAAETRERILKAVRAYGYYPNYSAQVLAGKRTTTLGLFFFRAGHFADDVLADFMISSVIENAAALGYHTLASVVRSPEDRATAAARSPVPSTSAGSPPASSSGPATGSRSSTSSWRTATPSACSTSGRRTGPSRTGRW